MKIASIPRWSVVETERADWNVADEHGKIVVANTDEATARMIAFGPRALRFVSLFGHNSPARRDIDTMMMHAGITVSHD